MKIRKIIWPLVSLLLVVYLCVMLPRGWREMDKLLCTAVEVTILDSARLHIITPEEVLCIYTGDTVSLQGLPLNRLNRYAIEKGVRNYPMIRSGEVYSTSDGILHIDVTQRTPLFRVLSDSLSGYITYDNTLMPLSAHQTFRVPVVTGNVSDSLLHSELFPQLLAWSRDPLWSAMIEQVDVDERGEWLLCTKLSGLKVRLGLPEKIADKMEKLRIFVSSERFREVWPLYKELDIRYNKQVVAVKR